MSKRTFLARALKLGRGESVAGGGRGEAAWPASFEEPPAADPDRSARGIGDEADGDLEAIFAAIRGGVPPWDARQLPADTGAADVLLTELDRLWQNPPAE